MPPLGANTKKDGTNPNDSNSNIPPPSTLQAPGSTSTGGLRLSTIARIRTLSISRKRTSTNASKQSVATVEGNFTTYNPEQEAQQFQVDEKKLNSLQKAVHDSDLKKVKKLLQEPSRDIDKLDTVHNFTALFYAVYKNNIEIVDYLLSKDESKKAADPNVACVRGRTALMAAVINDNLTIVKLLLDASANPNLEDEWRCRALNYALYNQKTEIAEVLIKKKAQIQFQDLSNATLLHHAARLGRTEFAQLLLKSGHDVDARDELERTPLHVAVKEKQIGIVGLLLSNKADVEAKDMNCQTVVDYFSYSSFSQELWNILQEYRTLQKSNLDLSSAEKSVPAFEITPASAPTPLAQAPVLESPAEPKETRQQATIQEESHNDVIVPQIRALSNNATSSSTNQSAREQSLKEVETLTEKYTRELNLRKSQEQEHQQAVQKLRMIEKELADLNKLQADENKKHQQQLEQERTEKENLKQQNKDLIAQIKNGSQVGDKDVEKVVQFLEQENQEKDKIIADLESTANFLTRRLDEMSQKEEQFRSSLSIASTPENRVLLDRIDQLEKLLDQRDQQRQSSISVSKTELEKINEFIRKAKSSGTEQAIDSGFEPSPNAAKSGLQPGELTNSITKSVKALASNIGNAKTQLEECIQKMSGTPVMQVFTVQIASVHELLSGYQRDVLSIEANVHALKQVQPIEEGPAITSEVPRVPEIIEMYNSGRRPSNASGSTTRSRSSSEAGPMFEIRRRNTSTIEKYEREIATLKQQLERLSQMSTDNQLIVLQNQLTAKEAEHANNVKLVKATLENELRKLQEELSHLKQERDKLSVQMTTIQQELSSTRDELSSRTNQLNEQKQLVRRSSAENEEALKLSEAAKEALRVENESLKQRMEDDQTDHLNRINRLENALTEAQAQIERVHEVEQAYKMEIDSLQRQILAYKSSNDVVKLDFENELAMLQQEKLQLNESVHEFKQENLLLQSKIAQLIQSQESSSYTNTLLLESKEKDIAELCNQLNELQNEKEQLLKQKTDLGQSVDSKTKEILSFIARIQELESTLQSERQDLSQLRLEIEHLNEQTLKMEELTRQAADLEVYQQRSTLLTNQLASAQQQLETKELLYREMSQSKLELETQVQQLRQEIGAKDARLVECQVQVELFQQKQNETIMLESMLQQQHQETLTQLRKYGLELNTSLQNNNNNNSLEMYLHAEKEARNLYERQLNKMADKHAEQIDVYKGQLFEHQKKLSVLEMKQSALEKDLVDRKVGFSVLQEKFTHLESKNQELLRKNSGLLNEMTANKAEMHAQQISQTNKLDRSESENTKLKLKVQELLREHQAKLTNLNNQYDSQIEKLIKRMQQANQQRLSIDQSRKNSHQALLDSYEQHIKTLTSELNSLRLNALKHQVSQCRRPELD